MVLRIHGVLLLLEHDSSIFVDFTTSFYDCYKTTRILDGIRKKLPSSQKFQRQIYTKTK